MHDASRAVYVSVGRATADHRLRPSFLLLGASRAGTPALFRALTDHPQLVRPPVNKGVHYFDLNYARGWRWYMGHFPLQFGAQKRAVDRPTVTFEASGYYLFHPFAAERIAADLPDAKLVVMVRDPVARAHSAWKRETARGFEWEPFERALDLEDERLQGEIERMRQDVNYESFCHRHHSYRSRGEYVDQLERILSLMPREQLHVIVSEEFFENPQEVYDGLLAFLGLAPHAPPSFKVHNASASIPLPDLLRTRLRRHFGPYDARLESLLGRPLHWSGR